MGRVLVVDGGGSLRRRSSAGAWRRSRSKNGWSGVVMFGAVRDTARAGGHRDAGIKALDCLPTEEREGGTR